MKINSIQKICKSQKRIILFQTPSGVQWISDGFAIFPLYGLPPLDCESVLVMFDIPEKKQDKIFCEIKSGLPEAYDFSDTADEESQLELGSISICAKGMTLLPLKTSFGITYINQKYLAPFSDSENGVTLYERTTPAGQTYIAVKEGFLLTGIILPYDIVTKDFVSSLKEIYELSAVAESNKNSLPDDEKEQMKLNDFID